MWDDGLTISERTPLKREITAIAARVSLDPDTVLGKLVRLWLWAKVNTEDGVAKGWGATQVDNYVGCPGFAEAMASPAVGWLRIRSDAVEFARADRLKRGVKPPPPVPAAAPSTERVRRHREKKRGADTVPRNVSCNADETGETLHETPGETFHETPCASSSLSLDSLSSSSEEEKASKEEENQSKTKAKKGSGGFSPPTVEDVRAYCRERGNRVDPETFVDHYTANGWRVGGRSAMRDWRAAVRTWEKNEVQRGAGQARAGPNLYGGIQQWLSEREGQRA